MFRTEHRQTQSYYQDYLMLKKMLDKKTLHEVGIHCDFGQEDLDSIKDEKGKIDFGKPM